MDPLQLPDAEFCQVVDSWLKTSKGSQDEFWSAAFGGFEGVDNLIDSLKPRYQRVFPALLRAIEMNSNTDVTVYSSLIRMCSLMSVKQPSIQSKILWSGILEELLPFVCQLLPLEHCAEGPRVLRSTFRFLTNFVTGNPSCQQVVWDKFFPQTFAAALHMKDQPAVEALCACIYNSVVKDSNRLKQLARSVDVIDALLHVAAAPDTENVFDWVFFSFQKLISDDLLPLVYDQLSVESQSLLLKTIDADVHQKMSDIKVANFLPIQTMTLLCRLFIDVMRDVLPMIQAAKSQSATQPPQEQSVTESTPDDISPEIMQERWSLLFLLGQILCNATSAGIDRDTQNILRSTGALSMIIQFLGISYRPPQRRGDPPAAEEKIVVPGGVKRDLVRIVANVVFNNPENQNEVLTLHGVEVILNHTNLDENNPYVREWAMFAVRNLCEGNTEVQTLIQSLQVQGVLDSPILAKAGVIPELDEVTGKVRLKKEGGSKMVEVSDSEKPTTTEGDN